MNSLNLIKTPFKTIYSLFFHSSLSTSEDHLSDENSDDNNDDDHISNRSTNNPPKRHVI